MAAYVVWPEACSGVAPPSCPRFGQSDRFSFARNRPTITDTIREKHNAGSRRGKKLVVGGFAVLGGMTLLVAWPHLDPMKVVGAGTIGLASLAAIAGFQWARSRRSVASGAGPAVVVPTPKDVVGDPVSAAPAGAV